MDPLDSASVDDPLPTLPPRLPDSHKGDFGRALLIGGARGMTGAIALSGMAALRGGAGLVELAVPEPCQMTVAGFEPAYLTHGLSSDAAGRIALSAREELSPLIENATAVACGPGLGRSADLDELVAWLYTTVARPLVLDADALNALAERRDILSRPAGPRILTPHPGEFGRLVGKSTAEALANRERLAGELAIRARAVVIVKGHRSLITDGTRSAINITGNPGLATGGTGDVLTGLIAALLSQGLSRFDAARLGTHVHGAAGDLAAAKFGEVGMIAGDVVRYLPHAIKNCGVREF